MDGAQPSRFPHLVWLHFGVAGDTGANPLVVSTSGACHTISLTTRGHHAVRWISRGRERCWTEGVGVVHFVPADDEHHTFVTAMSLDFMAEVLLLPRAHLDGCLQSEHMTARADCRCLIRPDDRILRGCIARVAAVRARPDADPYGLADEAARRLILRIAELCGGGRPDWEADNGTFDRRTLGDLVAYLDEHLRIAPSLGDLAIRVGLSPSHCARKFRLTTGLSLHRFINRRRIERSLEVLKQPASALAVVALDLGFSSQSHFTRLFSRLTGMTPARYRSQFRRTSG